MRYPEAPRLDLVEDLHGHRVADPYRWLEDAADPRTAAWTAAQDALAAELLAACRSGGFTARLEQLVHAGAVGVPVWRGGGRSPPAATPARSTPSCGSGSPTAPCGCWSTPWPSTRRGDDPGRLVAVLGGRPAGLPALHRRRRGVRLYVLDVATGEVSTGRSTAAATPPSPGCPAAGALLRPPAAAGPGPAGEEQFHRRVWRHRVGTPTRDDALVPGEGSAPPLLRGGLQRDGRWLVAPPVGTAPRNDLWIADLEAGRAARPCSSGSTPRPPPGWAATADCRFLRPRRAALPAGGADPPDPPTWTPVGLAGRRAPSRPTACSATSRWSKA